MLKNIFTNIKYYDVRYQNFTPEQQARIKETVRRASTEIKSFTPTMTPQMYEILNQQANQPQPIKLGSRNPPQPITSKPQPAPQPTNQNTTTTQTTTSQSKPQQQQNIKQINMHSHTEKKDKLWEVQFDSYYLFFYHKIRFEFFQRCRKNISFFTLLYITSEFSQFLQNHDYLRIIFAFLVVIFQIVDVVYDLSHQQALHYDLYKRYHKLHSTILIQDDNITDANIHTICEEYYDITRNQPAYYMALLYWCRNQVVFTLNIQEEKYKLLWYHNLFRNFWRFDGYNWKKIEERK